MSECTTRTVSNGTLSSFDTICANAISCPCPCGVIPVTALTVPSSPTETEPNSFDENAVTSTYVLTPIPSTT